MENKYIKETEKLLGFIGESPTAFHTVDNLRKELISKKYIELSESEVWKIKGGKNYFTVRNGSSLIAFKIPDKKFENILICAAHSDSPCFKIKPNPKQKICGCYTRLNCEKYGGMIYSSWTDRPLSVAGRIIYREKDKLKSAFVNFVDEHCIIPNAAIHMQRDINNGFAYNPQTDMQPLIGSASDDKDFSNMLSDRIGIANADLLDFDLYLYNSESSVIWGNNSYFSAPRIDDLQCVYAAKEAFTDAAHKTSLSMLAIFDNEEVGSSTKQGALSTFATDVLKRIQEALGITDSEMIRKYASSFMVSADNAHAVHPNHPELADITSQPKMNKGIVIKYNANQQYTTDALSASVFKALLNNASVPYQEFANRSDIPGGSTLGNLLNRQISLNTIDIGAAQLAMHSAYETAGVADTLHLTEGLKAFFTSEISALSNGLYSI